MTEAERKQTAKVYAMLSPAVKKGIYAKRIKHFVDSEVLIQKGNAAPAFTLMILTDSPLVGEHAKSLTISLYIYNIPS